ncbi:serine protease filzig-like isoform X3 [Sitodiplosis mosellana]|nr:serine protease filzig-like isoform X3 [Sitodiplosis mosellana]
MKFLSTILTFFLVILVRAERETDQPVLNLQKEELTTSAPSIPCHFEGELAAISENGSKQRPLNRNFQCGVRPHMRMRRIVGGKDSTFGAWPWQVLIRELTPNCSVTQYKYGGVLISDSYVLTVAHWRPEPNGVLVAVFGEYDLSKDLEPKKSVTIKVKEIIYHPEFNNRTFDNDLALLKLERPIQYDTHIVPICLPVHGADFTDRIATVSGWGRLRYGGRFPTVLQEVDVPIIENSKCQEMIHKLGYTKMILPSTLCAGYDEG